MKASPAVSAGEDSFASKAAAKNKKKTVRFGGPLSPEVFDKNLPPSTPLQKGGTPARAHTPGGSLKLRSVLKTPQRSDSQTPRGQPGLSSPAEFDASPVLKMPRNRRMQPVGEDCEEMDGKVRKSQLDKLLEINFCVSRADYSEYDLFYLISRLFSRRWR